jgi:uncharacterized protein
MAIRSPLHIAPRDDRPEEPVVARFRERVLAAFDHRVERIVLFGSRARGDEHAESDWDFAVFFDHDPTERERRALSDLTGAVQHEFDAEIQSMARSGQAWLGTDELSCNIRDHGRVVHGPAEIPMIERPVLQHARVALGKAERFAELSRGTPDDRFEGVIHGAYYAMFHAARAALLAVEGSASTNHGRVVDTFKAMIKRRRAKTGRERATALESAFELRMKADYGSEDLTQPGRELRDRMGPFLVYCQMLVEAAARGG